MSLLRINEIFNFEKGVLQSSKCVPGEFDFITASSEWKTHNEYTHDCEALVFAAAASGSLGRTHYVNGKFISSDLCFIITPKDQEKLPVDLKFYHILFNELKDDIVRNTKAGTSKEAIGLGSFGKYHLPYFDIETQIEIKNRFVNSEEIKSDLSNELIHQVDLVKKLRQQLLQDAVQGKLVPQNQNDEPASELLKRIKAEKAKLIAEKKLKKDPSTTLRAGKELPPIKPEEIPFEIPENWVWCRLGEVVSHIFDGPFGSHLKSSDYKNSGVQVIRLQNLGFMKFKEDKESFVSIEKYNTIKQHTVYEGDIIIGSFLADGVNCVILPKLNYTAIAKADCFTIRISHLNVIKRFVIFLLSSEPMFKELSKLLRGMTRLRINTTQLKNLPIPLPPLAEQNRIVQKLDELMQYCNELEASIKESEMQNEKLLQQVLREALSLPRVTRGKEPIVA